MIIATRSADTLATKAFGKKEVAISTITQVITQLPVDPLISHPRRDAYIVTSDDVKSPRVKQQFLDAVQKKHPDAIIVYVSKSAKTSIEEGDGIDSVLVRPKFDQLSAKVQELVSIHADKEAIHSSAEDAPEQLGLYKPSLRGFDLEEQEEPEEEQEVEEEYELPIPEEPEEVEEIVAPTEPTRDEPLEIVERFKSAGRVHDIAALSRELTANALIKDVMDKSSTYANAEEKLKALENQIYTVMASTEIPTLEQKLERVRALLHDKNYYKSRMDTVLEQRIEGIIDTVISTTKDLVESRLEEIDHAIYNNQVNNKTDFDYARLAGLTEERANLIMELTVLSMEIDDIAKGMDSFVLSAAGYMADQAIDLTSNAMLNARLRLTNETIVSDKTQAAIRAAIEISANEIPEEMRALRLKVQVYLSKLNQLFDLDKQTIVAQREYINFLQANDIEDTVAAQTLIKKSLRVFVGAEGNGRTIIPYLLSYYKSRQNANVLLVDLTGTCKSEDYGLHPIPLQDYYDKRYEKKFCYVAGEIHDTPSAAQRILNMLVKAADFYSVINVVLPTEARSLFDVMAPDVLCVNYITDTSRTSLQFMKEFIAETEKENTARRVIINKCNVNTAPILHKLGLDDVMNIGLCKVGYVDGITDASINGYNPAEMSSVSLALEEVLRYVRT